ncbi:protein of unknown function (plasmid) [Caballeronia sp. S22]
MGIFLESIRPQAVSLTLSTLVTVCVETVTGLAQRQGSVGKMNAHRHVGRHRSRSHVRPRYARRCTRRM